MQILFVFVSSVVVEMNKVVDDLVVGHEEEEMMESINIRIELSKIEEAMRKGKVACTYLKEGGLISFMASINCHDDKAS